ncbi:MAG: replicative DNA helicase [Hormoscilla sp.]
MVDEPDFKVAGDRLPPQNIPAEEEILGGILLDPEAIGRVADILRPEAFSLQAHQRLYRCALTLQNEGKPTDLTTVATWLSDQNWLDQVGGMSKLAQLVDRTVSAVNIDEYAKLVMDKYLRRQLIQAGHDIVGLGFETSTELEVVMDRAEQRIFDLSQDRFQQGLVPISKTLIGAFQEIELQNQGAALPGIPCGFYDLDQMTGGFQRSDLIIVAGRPSMGKCLASNSVILLATGEVATIAEIYQRRQAQLLTLGEDSKFAITSPSAFVDDGIKPVFRVQTRLGRVVETTITHPFLTINGWQQLGHLQKGDRIAVPRRLEVFGTESLGDCQIKTAHNKTIPPIVFKLRKSQLALFLNRLFCTDGWATVSSNGQSQLGYATASEQLARQIQHLLLRLGIIAAIKKSYFKSQDPPNDAWQINITDSESIRTFISEIGIFGKEENLSLVQASLAQRRHQNNCDIIPQDFLQELATSDVYWDEIVSIASVGLQQVYDLTIPETHNFVANDICVHNTSFALNIARSIAATPRLPIAIFSLEMSCEQLVMRLLSSEAKIESNRLRAGRISQLEWDSLSKALGTLSDLPIFIDDTPNQTVGQMRSQARRLQAEQGGALGLILIDYLQLMEGASDNRVQELSRITRQLKGLARELNVPVITLSQLSRGVESRNNKRPMMSDLRESGSIEQDSDLILMLYRDEYYNPDTPDRNIAEVIITKHRNGPTGVVKLLFDSHLTRFRNLAQNDRV